MNGILLLDGVELGKTNFQIIDESMGVIGGKLAPSENYFLHQKQIQSICESKGISNVDDFNFTIQLTGIGELYLEGGIGVTDIKGFNEIFVEAGGLNWVDIELLKTPK